MRKLQGWAVLRSSHALSGVCALFLGAAPVIAQFCPDTGTILSTSDAAEGDAPFAVRCCDLNTDGFPDLVTANDASDTVSVLLNNGDGTYAPKVQWPVDDDGGVVSEPVDVVCCDLDGDDLIDLVSVNHTSDDVSVLLNTGNTQFAAAVKYPVGEAPFGIECLNLDGDADKDLVTNGFTEDALSVLLNNGDATFAPHVTYPTGDAPIAMALCDMDGDAVADVVTANMLGKEVSVLRNNADGTFTAIGSASICRTPTECINPFDIACCDFDGANGPDVVTSNGIDDSAAVLLNDGTGQLGGATFYDGVDGAYGVTCCDLDGNAAPDVITANLSSGSTTPPAPDDLAVFLNDGTGTLGTLSSLPVGVDGSSDPSSVVCCDVDGDTDADIVTTFVDGLTLFENDCLADCGDGSCDPPEDKCNCPEDCGAPDANEIPDGTCNDGVDNDCDGAIDCDDADCDTDTLCSGGCFTDEDCEDGTICTWDRCIDQACSFEPNKYGDVDHNGVLNLFDIFCILDGIAGDFSTCAFEDVDIEPCAGNDTLNIFDIFAVLDAIGGIDPCCS